jgi:hypothetical protein
MKKIENYENVQASSGEFARPTAGGYICKIIDVEDVPLNEQGKGNYLRIDYDIADGEFAEYYKKQFDRWGGNWIANFIRSYKDTAVGMFKHFTNSVEKSNTGYEWDWNEKGLIGKFVGLILGEEEYKNSAGEIKTKLVVKQVKTVDEIKNGDFSVPEKKKLEITNNAPKVDNFGFMKPELVQDDLPF